MSFGQPFRAVLEVLNRAPVFTDPAQSPFTHPVAENLIRVYAQEIHAIESHRRAGNVERNRLLHEQVVRENKRVGEILRRSSLSTTNARDRVGPELRRKIFRRLSTNVVSRTDAEGAYDQRGDIGFCFGRAMMVHYLLRKAGVRPEAIAKIFAIGSLKYGDQLWQFHEAILVRGEGGAWWVIDNLFDKVLPHDQWMTRVSALGINTRFPDVRFYVTDARKFQPAYGAYRAEDLNIPELKFYFEDLFHSIGPQKVDARSDRG